MLIRRYGGVRELWWRLPKHELSANGRKAGFAFELFDERSQSSRFYPGVPSFATLTFSGGNTITPQGKVPVTVHLQPNPSTKDSAPAPHPETASTPPAAAEHAAANGPETQATQEPEHPTPLSAHPGGPSYRMQVSSQGTIIASSAEAITGRHYSSKDPRFSSGSELMLTVNYDGAEPNQTEISVAWYVGDKPVSYFPTFEVAKGSGHWSRAYDNEAVEPGEHRIVLEVDGQEKARISFWLDADQPSVPAPPSPPTP